MADENGNDNEGKGAKTWEQHLAWRNAFLDQWRTELAPVDAQIALATESATSLALTGLRSGYLLNGGALIALPAFIEIFNKFKIGDTNLFVFAAVPFVLGLIMCAVANFLGYKCVNTASSAHLEARNWRALQVTEYYYPNKDRVSTAKTIKISKDKSDDLFRNARKEENIATIFFIASLFLFVIGVVSSLLMWAGIEGIPVMEVPNFIIKLLDVLAWPAAVVLIALVLRQSILTFIRRWRRGNGRGSGGPEPTPPGQVDTGGPSTKDQLSTTQADPVPAVENLVQVLRRQLDEVESTLDIDRETALFRALARANLREHFERTHRIIWGSQMRALQVLNSVTTANVDFLKSYYDTAANEYPSLYEEYSYDGWLRFLEGQALLIRKDDVVEITMEGREFLKYLVEMQLTPVKVG